MIKEIKYFLTALMFFTRIPVPEIRDFKQEYSEKSSRYLPLIGIIVGGMGAVIYWGSSRYLPENIAVVLSIISTIIITGGFHEDGFADSCDAFGGGWSKEQILKIMKDSRVGSFGVLGIVMILLLKYQLLVSLIPVTSMIFVIISAHSISRVCAISLLLYSSYVRQDESSKSKSSSQKISFAAMNFAFVIAITPLLLFQKFSIFYSLIPCLLTAFLMSLYFKKRIGGFTGDCLGAVQQVTEVVFYLSILVLSK